MGPFNFSSYWGNIDISFLTVSWSGKFDLPPAAFLWPPPSKKSLAISFTGNSPIDLKDHFTRSSFSIFSAAITIPLIERA